MSTFFLITMLFVGAESSEPELRTPIIILPDLERVAGRIVEERQRDAGSEDVLEAPEQSEVEEERSTERQIPWWMLVYPDSGRFSFRVATGDVDNVILDAELEKFGFKGRFRMQGIEADLLSDQRLEDGIRESDFTEEEFSILGYLGCKHWFPGLAWGKDVVLKGGLEYEWSEVELRGYTAASSLTQLRNGERQYHYYPRETRVEESRNIWGINLGGEVVLNSPFITKVGLGMSKYLEDDYPGIMFNDRDHSRSRDNRFRIDGTAEAPFGVYMSAGAFREQQGDFKPVGTLGWRGDIRVKDALQCGIDVRLDYLSYSRNPFQREAELSVDLDFHSGKWTLFGVGLNIVDDRTWGFYGKIPMYEWERGKGMFLQAGVDSTKHTYWNGNGWDWDKRKPVWRKESSRLMEFSLSLQFQF